MCPECGNIRAAPAVGSCRDPASGLLLIIKYQNYIDINKYFIGATMFFSDKIVFDKIIDFIKNNNYRSYFINNLYDTNSVNKLASPVHFLERLFGLIR